jgi:large subunit ribosomal protein L9
MLGMHPVSVSLHPEVTVEVMINVARSEDEAALQARTGRSAPRTGEEEALDEIAIEEQAMAVFEEDAAEHVIEEMHADEEVAEEESQGKK